MKNNAQAQRELYEMHKVKWFMICLRYAHNKDEAQDMLQEGLISVFNNLKQYDSTKASFAVWSNKVMVNAALQQLRKWKKLKFDEEITDYENKLSKDEDVFASIGAKVLTAMVQNLPEGYRVVFNLYVVEGYLHREIGEMLGISESTSKTQLLKAKKMLRNQLEKVLHY
ncbi:MAG TPA: sigma-70 family RNA polymerase sigma factor [Bacteroidales bacterium]